MARFLGLLALCAPATGAHRDTWTLVAQVDMPAQLVPVKTTTAARTSPTKAA